MTVLREIMQSSNTTGLSNEEIISDYEVAYQSRLASLAGRKEVLAGKAKFGIFGDGKEVAQVAMARSFQKGDWRSGYYRDQTFMLAIKATTIQQFFSQLYADTNIENEPASGGRQMNCHFASRYLDDKGCWANQMEMKNVASDLSPTAGQMAKLVGLGYASKIYRHQKKLAKSANTRNFSDRGNEVAFGTIGNASTSEGVFWESINAIGVLQVPVAISVWDDEFGISVPAKYHTTKQSISKALSGFQADDTAPGLDIHVLHGWNYPELVSGYREGIKKCRKEHAPALFHIVDMTQPQGHSTSGSHERYKTQERLAFEDSIDCIKKMRAWIITEGITTPEALSDIEKSCEKHVDSERQLAWEKFISPLQTERSQAISVLEEIADESPEAGSAERFASELNRLPVFSRRNIHSTIERCLLDLRNFHSEKKSAMILFLADYKRKNQEKYSKFYLCESERSPLTQKTTPPEWGDAPVMMDGRAIIQAYFDLKFAEDPRIFMIGEDVGKIGGVNAEFEGLQKKHGELTISDTGIREATILGQGIGAAMRGLRPIVEIQYLDYLLYCIQTLSDDLATLHHRSAGGQAAPCIIRTRGHRLEGVWHSGSPMSMILGAVRGIHVCVPRNCTQAAGMYQTLLKGDDPALVIEPLNGYRVKEAMPNNLGEFSVPLGVPEILLDGNDITIVTYGANVRLAHEAADILRSINISIELIDVQTLLPFDTNQIIRQSTEKTNAIIFLDEDVPGGASAYMMQQVLDVQNAYEYLDASPRCLSSHPHRPAYASDGDYYSKPNVENIIQCAYEIMHERSPEEFPNYK